MASSYKNLPLGFLFIAVQAMPRAPRQPASITRARAQTQRAPSVNINPCTIGSSTTDVDDDFNAAFLQEFDQEESWRFRERSQMTDEEHAAFLERAKNAPSVARSWAKSTRHNVYTLDKKWTAYCAKYNLGDPEEALPTTDRARAMDFLTFMCANYDINRIVKREEDQIYLSEKSTTQCLDVKVVS